MNILASRVTTDGDVATARWDFKFQASLWYSVAVDDFTTLARFKKWLFDPEARIDTKYGLFDVFWPHCALRVAGLDFSIGLCVRPPQSVNMKTRERV